MERDRPRKPAEVVIDKLKRSGVIRTEDDLTPEMLQLIKELNEAIELIKQSYVEPEEEAR